MDDAAYDGSPLGEPDATASSGAAPSTAAARSCTEPPPPHPSAARAADCPPCSTTGRDTGRDREPLQIAQFRLELRAERDKVFDPARRAERVAERDVQSDTVCSDAAPPLRAKQTAPVGSTSDSESEATACGDDTDTELAGIDDDDESPSDGETKLPTFSMVRTLHESVDVVRIALFPPPPVVESAEPTAVDWNAATPPIADWPSGLRDLFDGNPAGAQTWDEVTTALQKLVIYHAVRRTLSRCLSRRANHDERTLHCARSSLRRCRLLCSP